MNLKSYYDVTQSSLSKTIKVLNVVFLSPKLVAVKINVNINAMRNANSKVFNTRLHLLVRQQF